jgi:predicted aminopeptidase
MNEGGGGGHEKQNSARARLWRWTLRAALALLVLVLLFLGATERGRYIVRAAWEEGRILWRRRAIAEIVADTTVPAETRAKLRLVLEARAYAADVLKLDVGRSFTTFSQLDSDTLVLLLSAAHRDRLVRYRWWFPVVGRVPYKGFFDFGKAREEAREFDERGLDTYLRPASAFSTLGFFNDPLVSSTLRADTISLANTVIHELTHNTFYASGEAEFNESFANFVGARGSAEFFRSRGQMRAVEMAEARWADDQLLALFWKRLHGDIDSVFKAHPGDQARGLRLRLRDSIYAEARGALRREIGPRLRTIPSSFVERARLDNAALLARRIYLTDLDLFDSVYARAGRDTRRAAAIVMELAEKADDPFDAIRSWLSAPR